MSVLEVESLDNDSSDTRWKMTGSYGCANNSGLDTILYVK